MKLRPGEVSTHLQVARVRAWLAALASLVLLIPIALLILLIADHGESPQGWLELLVVIVAPRCRRWRPGGRGRVVRLVARRCSHRAVHIRQPVGLLNRGPALQPGVSF